MGLSGHAVGVDAEMPDVRGGVCGVVHGHWRFRLNGAMDSDFNAGVLFGVAGLSGG